MDEDMRKLITIMAEQQQVLIKVLQGQKAIQENAVDTNTTEVLINNITDFHYDPDNGVLFENWFARYEDIFQVDAEKLDDAAKVRALLRKIDTDCHEKYTNLILPKHPRELSFVDTVAKLKSIFGRKSSQFNARFKCLQVQKNEHDDFNTYAGIVNRHCENFNISNITPDQFKSLIFVCGLQSHKYSDIRSRLLAKIENVANETISLDTLAEECHRIVNLKEDTHMIENPKPVTSTVNILKNKNNRERGNFGNTPPVKDKGSNAKAPSSPCWQCGEMHFVKNCSFSTHLCSICKVVGHKEGYCSCFTSKNREKKPNKNGNKQKKQWKSAKNKTNKVQINQIDTVTRRKFITICMSGVPVKMQYDTASDITIVSRDTWLKIGQPKLSPTTCTAVTASQSAMRIPAEFECSVKFQDKLITTICYITTVENCNLLGLDVMDKFRLHELPISSICNQVQQTSKITGKYQNDIQTEIKLRFPKLFSENLGLYTKSKVNLQLKDNAKPIFRQKRPVAYASLQPIEDELYRLQQLGVVTPVDTSEWAAPIVVVKKPNGQIRICADYSTGLNDVLEPHQYPLPKPDDIFAKLANSTVFSHIDLSDAFLQVEVSEDSRELLTINTHRGLYRMNRLQPGVKTAPGAFQQIMDQLTAGLDGVASYMDDVIVAGRDEKSHRDNLFSLLKKIEDSGFHLKMQKCEFSLCQIKYLGHIIDKNGIHSDPERTTAISNMPEPHNIATLRSYLGAVNFYGKFIREMRSIREPLDNLLKKDSKFVWSKECQNSFKKFKEIMMSDLVLAHYDPEMEVIVAADASQSGIGACIQHKYPDGNVKAIYHASRSLTPAETRYSQIEKEALALIFAVTKFHRYIYGRKFTLQTDHKPLISIFGSKKGIPVYTANRLQRWALTLLLYDYKIEYISTNEFGYADVLSRLIGKHHNCNEEYIIASVNTNDELSQIIVNQIQKLPVTFNMIDTESKKYKPFRKIKNYLQSSWPTSLKDPEIKPYYSLRNAISSHENCLLFGDRVICPPAFRKRVLDQLHKSHPGQERMKSLARSYVYWPNIDAEIKDYVQKCSQCAEAADSPTKSTLHSWLIPTSAWQRIHADFAGPINSKFYLIIVDALSKWPEVIEMSTITSSNTITEFIKIFARFGNPEYLTTDNGTQFDSALFKEFTESRGIKHYKTAPYHPQSNGQAERFVKTFKKALQKFKSEEMSGMKFMESLQQFLQTYRSTPHRYTPGSKSPAEILLGTRIRTTLDLMKPQNQAKHSTNAELIKNQAKQNQQFNDKHGATERFFDNGDTVLAKVYVQSKFRWMAGTIIERIGEVMYNVLLTTNKRLIRSHINQLRRAHEKDNDDKIIDDSYGLLVDAFEMPIKSSNVMQPPTQTAECQSTTESQTGSVANSPGLNEPSNSSVTTPSWSPVTPPFVEAVGSPIRSPIIDDSTHHTPARPVREKRLPRRLQDYVILPDSADDFHSEGDVGNTAN